METVTTEAKLTLKLLEESENTIKEKRHTDRSVGGGDISSKTADIHTRMNNNNIGKIESSLGGSQITTTFAGRTT